MTLANQLTLLRIGLALAMFLALVQHSPSLHLAALIMFAAAVVTDWIDGYVARATNSVSAFGKVVDPIADKILVIGAFIALIHTKRLHIPLWGVFLIVARDLLIGGVRVLASSQGRSPAAEQWGKWKMGVQSGSIAVMLIVLVLGERGPDLPAWAEELPYLLTVLCVVVTWLSAYIYFRQSRKLLEKSWG